MLCECESLLRFVFSRCMHDVPSSKSLPLCEQLLTFCVSCREGCYLEASPQGSQARIHCQGLQPARECHVRRAVRALGISVLC
jgi:hypothetical protein